MSSPTDDFVPRDAERADRLSVERHIVANPVFRTRDALLGGVLIAVDLLALAASFGIGRAVSHGVAPLRFFDPVIDAYLAVGFAIFALSYLLTVRLLDLYPGRGILGPERIKRRQAAALISVVAPIVVISIGTGSSIPIVQGLVWLPVMAVVSPLLEMLTVHLLDRTGLWRRPVVLHGTRAQTARIAAYVRLFPELGFDPIAENLFSAVWEHDSAPDLMHVEDGQQVWALAVDNNSLPSFAPANRATLVRLHKEVDRLGLMVKRVLDVAAVFVLAIPVSLLALVISTLIVSFDGFPIFYSQERRGINGRVIRVWKFRSMYRDADKRLESQLEDDPSAQREWLCHFKLKDDPRILPRIGTFIRRTSIDEFPQLWNVLRGDMSMIGPRPFPDYHLEAFSEEFRAIRCRMPPGLSGLWQVTMRSDADLSWQQELDCAYIEGWSIWLDLYILFRTPIALFSGRGAR